MVSDLKLGFDQLGEIRWLYTGDGSAFFGKLRNGNMIFADGVIGKVFFEVTMLGQHVKKIYCAPRPSS